MKHWKLNTSNPGKAEEFKLLFKKLGIDVEITHLDLEEIIAEPIKVVAHKAGQVDEGIVVEDTSLEIEGASVGINIRWLLEHLAEYVGRKAEWVVLLAFRQGGQINIYKGSVAGTIVMPKGTTGFGFDPYFLPDGSKETLSQSKTDTFNARAKAVAALINGDVWTKHPMIENWEGPWQN